MKNIIYYIVVLLLLCSCDDYLNVVPDNVPTIEHSFRNRIGAEKFLFSCYSYRPPVGSVDKDPAMNGGDETWECYNKTRYVFTNSYLARGYQNVSDPILNTWDGRQGSRSLWQGIRDCNIFIENAYKVVDFQPGEMKRMIAEAEFLKAYYHFYLLKSYGPIPITDHNLPINVSVDEVQVFRDPVDKVFKYIVEKLDQIIPDLPYPEQMILETELGRADRLTALTMKAEVLLYEASPLFNGNSDYVNFKDERGISLFPQSYDDEKWKHAADACKIAIDECAAHGKLLHRVVDPLVSSQDPFFQEQTTYREAICGLRNKELIWPSTNINTTFLSINASARIVRMSAENLNKATSEWAPTIKLIEKYYSENGVPINEDKDWVNNNWYNQRFKLRPEPSNVDERMKVELNKQTVYLHFHREPRFYASLGFDKGVYFGSGYYNFTGETRNVQYCNFINFGKSGYQGGSGYSITGYSVKKMHSFKDALSHNNSTKKYFSFPIYRLANLYLMYAEALNEYSGPSSEVFKYLDDIRSRAGLQGVKESWTQYSINPTKPDTKDGLRDIIHQERTIELAFEGKRFWDIRRWKKIEVLNEQPRGWNILADNQEEFYKVLNIAVEPVEFGVKDYFWPLKESNLDVNEHLIQNYGW
ncbi:RagB/SusD family nutrient uptake outer membrane protein [Halosquirtibacter laminarini]|uniref:RagB/SusD family nutrient uptake outer membrane protein n=1 Tax=Halosquirtibacter laminarini TaxID=3374600 RepID=A0AC61NLV8_9BACT|nr:RagB/SusD family nutrient uptake outer membrane protein [Prolixibacteraceae bacterium]